MDPYHLWFGLRPGSDAAKFAAAFDQFVEHLVSSDAIVRGRLSRRKLGFGPSGLGEFHAVLECKDMAQLDAAFDMVKPRSGDTEKKHAKVWSQVDGLQTALYRDFPDA